MNDSDYVEKAVRKLTEYAREGILPGVNLIVTFETKAIPLQPEVVELIAKKYLQTVGLQF